MAIQINCSADSSATEPIAAACPCTDPREKTPHTDDLVLLVPLRKCPYKRQHPCLKLTKAMEVDAVRFVAQNWEPLSPVHFIWFGVVRCMSGPQACASWSLDRTVPPRYWPSSNMSTWLLLGQDSKWKGNITFPVWCKQSQFSLY